MRAAASRIFCTAGNKRAIRIPMMAMTTNSSISVNAHQRLRTDLPRDLNIRWVLRRELERENPNKVAAHNVGAAHRNMLDKCLRKYTVSGQSRESQEELLGNLGWAWVLFFTCARPFCSPFFLRFSFE